MKGAKSKKLGELRGNPRNPRKLSQEQADLLRRQLEEFGDISGVVFNVRTKQLVTGHQRAKEFWRKEAAIQIIKRHEKPTSTGTVAEGSILIGDESFAYREVDWPEDKAKLAMLAGNNHAGAWEDAALAKVLDELDSKRRN